MNTKTTKANIMIVDDTPANIKVLREILQNEGYRLIAFPKGSMALRAASKAPPDLILLDIMMPEMDGFEVCKHLKTYEELKDIPVIFISARDDVDSKVKAFSKGGVDYVTKPFQEKEVISRIETHLSLRKMQIELQSYSHHLEERVRAKVREIAESQQLVIAALADLVEVRDESTGEHIKRTQILCTKLAAQLRFCPDCRDIIDDAFVDRISKAAALHDIGKVGIPDDILFKPEKLTADEFEVIKKHTEIGANTLKRIQEKYPTHTFIDMGVDIARSHHEKWDGTGYPDGLERDEIPLAGRIMALVDVYDALTSERPYGKSFTHEKARNIILEGSGVQFDPCVIEAFEAVEFSFKQPRQPDPAYFINKEQ